MSTKDFSKLLKSANLQKIVYMHCNLKINLTDKQLDKVLDLKKKKEAEQWKS